MDDLIWSNDFYSDMFSLDLDKLLNTIDLESLETKENDTAAQVHNTTNQVSERAALKERTIETNLPAPVESRFPLSSNELIQETLTEAEIKIQNRSKTTWMRVYSSWAKSRNINVNMEVMAPATKYYLEVTKQDGPEYEPDSLKVMQVALERYLSSRKYPCGLISGREFSSSRAALDAKAKQLQMNGYGRRKNRAQPYNSAEEELFWSIVRALRFWRPPRPLRRLRARLGSCVGPDRGRRNGEVRAVQREPNEDSYWWFESKTPKNSVRDVGHGWRTKRSRQTLRRVSQETPVRNANLWAFVLGNNTASRNRCLVRQVQNGRAQTWLHHEDPGTGC